jgi:hypothetical protein
MKKDKCTFCGEYHYLVSKKIIKKKDKCKYCCNTKEGCEGIEALIEIAINSPYLTHVREYNKIRYPICRGRYEEMPDEEWEQAIRDKKKIVEKDQNLLNDEEREELLEYYYSELKKLR